jgi:hypothetical protein
MNNAITKPGEHGTLYLYEIKYTDPSDSDCMGTMSQRVFAYNTEHALDKFYNSVDADGWKALSTSRVHRHT